MKKNTHTRCRTRNRRGRTRADRKHWIRCIRNERTNEEKIRSVKWVRREKRICWIEHHHLKQYKNKIWCASRQANTMDMIATTICKYIVNVVHRRFFLSFFFSCAVYFSIRSKDVLIHQMCFSDSSSDMHLSLSVSFALFMFTLPRVWFVIFDFSSIFFIFYPN